MKVIYAGVEVSRLLQQCVARRQWSAAEEAADSAERRSTCRYAVKKVRSHSHHASAERTSLVARRTACTVQAGADSLQVPQWPGTVLPRRRLRPRVVRGWSTSAADR